MMDDTLPRGDHQNLPPGCESSKTGSCPPVQQPTLSEVSDIIRTQIEAGFRRRREAFVREVFDKRRSPDVDGISRENLVPALKDIGINVSASEADELFYTQDMNCDGSIDRAEFLLMSKRLGKLEEWTSTLPLSQLLADCMPATDEADPVRVVSNLAKAHIRAIANCFSEGLVVILTEGVDKLKHAYECMDRNKREAASRSPESSGKFAVLSQMSCGNVMDFRNGLSARIGDAILNFMKAMEAEHCHTDESCIPFTTRNFGIQTCPRAEWRIVVDCDKSSADLRCNRKIHNVQELLQHPTVTTAKLSLVEVISVVLYTGYVSIRACVQ
jgi:hypothetical protein